ncbi:TetR family transcriptional regulator [Haloactinopolyspora alba]|uniref:TetR family transcriptional regulator n=1 Tax=Haloactinopolyspora alba TaxID=648780 RepID=A0A2P8E5A2_9ACTN|nr:TetR/AcrR family transcriptional regulator [Haloactinopolyspora alba]PSL04643.1 TetR family transcriptional regulator [Haloactinopolyspora alba]
MTGPGDSARAADLPGADLRIADQPRPERADAARNRRLLIDAAERLVREHGVAALSMEAVAEAAGVGVGTVYRRFGDLAGLAYALLDAQERVFQEEVLHGPPPVGPGAPPAERLHAFVHRYVERLDNHGELLTTAETMRYQAGAYRLQHLHLSTLISEIDSGLDAEYLAGAILETLAGRLFVHQNTDRGFSAERIKAGLDQLLRGITG